ncbi:MAG: hypothetical protein ACI8RD_006534, partial [Bacillariaceae sp.]
LIKTLKNNAHKRKVAYRHGKKTIVIKRSTQPKKYTA